MQTLVVSEVGILSQKLTLMLETGSGSFFAFVATSDCGQVELSEKDAEILEQNPNLGITIKPIHNLTVP